MSFPWPTLGAGLVALAPFAWSQQPQLHREIPEDAFRTRELIVWSGVQKLPPTPQPFPAPDVQTSPPHPQSEPPAVPRTPQTAAQSFSGWIVRNGERYGLQATGNTTYELDGQIAVEQYANKNVHIVGNLEAASNTIHIVKIEPIS